VGAEDGRGQARPRGRALIALPALERGQGHGAHAYEVTGPPHLLPGAVRVAQPVPHRHSGDVAEPPRTLRGYGPSRRGEVRFLPRHQAGDRGGKSVVEGGPEKATANYPAQRTSNSTSGSATLLHRWRNTAVTRSRRNACVCDTGVLISLFTRVHGRGVLRSSGIRAPMSPQSTVRSSPNKTRNKWCICAMSWTGRGATVASVPGRTRPIQLGADDERSY
jgi:hypothetical protein